MKKKENEYKKDSIKALEYIEDVEELNSAISAQFKKIEEEKWPRASQWFTNLNFLAGIPLSWDRSQVKEDNSSNIHLLQRAQELNISPPQVDNHIVRIVSNTTSSLTQTKPYPKISPISDFPDDWDLAKVSEYVVGSVWEYPLKLNERLREVGDYLSIFGDAAVELSLTETDEPVEVEKKRIVKKIDDLTGEEYEEEQGTGETEWVYKTGLRTKVWSPFHFDVNQDATSDPDSISWISVSSYEDITWVRRQFDKKGKEFIRENIKNISPVPSNYSSPLWYASRVRDIVDTPSTGNISFSARGRERLTNQVLVRRIYTKPNTEFPKGRLIIQAGDKIIYLGESLTWNRRYPHRWHPFILFGFWNLPLRHESQSLVSMCIPLQKKINAIHAMLRISRQSSALGTWIIPNKCNVPPGTIGMFNQEIRYDPDPRTGSKPERVPYPGLPGDVFSELSLTTAALERLAGINTAPQLADAPSAVRSANMLDFFQRQALASQSSVLLNFESSLERLTEAILIECSLNFDTNEELRGRLSNITSRFGSHVLDKFRNMSLSDNLSIQIDIRSQILRTPESKRDSAAQFLQAAGGTLSPVERAKVAKTMGLDEFSTSVNPQYDRAKRIVEYIIQGNKEAAVPLDGIDDPGIFADVIRTELLSPRIIDSSFEVKETLLSLLDHYKNALTAQIAQAQLMAPQAPERSANES